MPLTKEVIYMPNSDIKVIEALLIKNDKSEIVIRFKFSQANIDLNLQSDDSEQIKNVFLELSKELRTTPIKVNLTSDKSIDDKTDGLFKEASDEYINQLNTEILNMEKDEDLKTIRAFNNRKKDLTDQTAK